MVYLFLEAVMKLKKMFFRLYSDSGLFLFVVRIPSKAIKFALDLLITNYYRLSLKKVGEGFRMEWGAVIESPGRVVVGSNVFIGKGTVIWSETCNGSLILGNNVEIGRGCRIDITGNVVIHDNVLMSKSCQILTHSHGYNPRSKPHGLDLIIAESVWLGSEAFIMENCHYISSFSILATRAVLTKSLLEERSIAAGIPAVIIGKNNG